MPDLTHARLSRRAFGWRVLVLALGVAAVTRGTLSGRDEDWPFGPMGQYAFYVPPDSEISSPGVEADTIAGQTVRVPLTADGVGIRRAEIEAQVPRIIADPSRLQAVAVQAAVRHPRWPRYRALRLVDDVTVLRGGRVVDRVTRVLAEWRVVDPAAPRMLGSAAATSGWSRQRSVQQSALGVPHLTQASP
ncbi:MAG: hypothetical protein ACRC35_07350 [Angustibacter sp.]